MKKIFYSFIFVILLLNFAIAAPTKPFSSQTFSEGFEIKTPLHEIFKVNQDYEFEFHIYNISNGKPMNTGLSCYFHLYNSTGTHQAELYDDTPSHNYDYSFNVIGSNFSKADIFYYNIQCNNSANGGYNSGYITITNSGLDIDEVRIKMLIFIIGLFVLTGLFLLILGILKKDLLPIKSTFIIIGGILLLVGFNFASITMLEINTNPNIENFFEVINSLAIYAYYFAAFLLILIWIITFVVTSFSKAAERKEYNNSL